MLHPEKPVYTDLTSEQKKRFCFLVYQYRKKGYTIPDAKRESILKCEVSRYLQVFILSNCSRTFIVK